MAIKAMGVLYPAKWPTMEMLMTTIGTENQCRDSDAAKKRAHAIKSRLKEMGHEASLSHSYEVLATAYGYRNWPTMKASTRKTDQQECAVEAPTIAKPKFGEVRGSINRKIIFSGDTCETIEIQTDPVSAELFKSGTASEIVALVTGKISDKGSWYAEWKGRVTALLTVILTSLVYYRDHEWILLDVKAVRDAISLDGYIKLATRTMRSDLPERTRQLTLAHWNGAGYLGTSGADQHVAIVEAHSYAEALISDALSAIETDIKWHEFKTRRRTKAYPQI
jgi:hypothetical protein